MQWLSYSSKCLRKILCCSNLCNLFCRWSRKVLLCCTRCFRANTSLCSLFLQCSKQSCRRVDLRWFYCWTRNPTSAFHRFWQQFFGILGKTAVNLFVVQLVGNFYVRIKPVILRYLLRRQLRFCVEIFFRRQIGIC